MATLTVNTYNEREKKVLVAFLRSLNYDYVDGESEETFSLTDVQKKEILRRDRAYEAGETSARTWDEIKADFE